MTADAVPQHESTWQEKFLQRLKWVIYTFLTINFFYYWYEDWSNAQFTLTAASSFGDWVSAYAATWDFISWMVLIAVYEIETYWLEDDFDNTAVIWLMNLTKAVCYGLILRTTYAYIGNLNDVMNVTPIADVSDLCSLANQNYAFLRNLAYTEVTAETCLQIPYAGDFYLYPREPVITDTAGLAEDTTLRQADLIENISWLIVVAMIELTVQLQNRGYHEGSAIAWSNGLKLAAYLTIAGAAIYWLSKGHYVYAWDEFVWIAGFAALDVNLSEWRHELEEEEEHAAELEAQKSQESAEPS